MFPFLFYGAQFRTSICGEEESWARERGAVLQGTTWHSHMPRTAWPAMGTPGAPTFPDTFASVWEYSALNTLWESRTSCQAGPGETQSPAKVLELMGTNWEWEWNETTITWLPWAFLCFSVTVCHPRSKQSKGYSRFLCKCTRITWDVGGLGTWGWLTRTWQQRSTEVRPSFPKTVHYCQPPSSFSTRFETVQIWFNRTNCSAGVCSARSQGDPTSTLALSLKHCPRKFKCTQAECCSNCYVSTFCSKLMHETFSFRYISLCVWVKHLC